MNKLLKIQAELVEKKKKNEALVENDAMVVETDDDDPRKWRTELQGKLDDLKLERDAEKRGETKWRVKDFGGQYHLQRIRNKHPVPGSNLTVERIRIKAAAEKETIQEKKRAEKEAALQLKLENRGIAAMQAETLKLNFDNRKYLQEDVIKTIQNREERLMVIKQRNEREKGAFGAASSQSLVNFFTAIREGDADAVNRDLQLRVVEPNDVADFNGGKTALIEACENQRVSMAHLLLQFGADPSQKDLLGRGPIHAMWEPYHVVPAERYTAREVVLRNMETILSHLIQHKVDLAMRNIDGETALHLAAKAGEVSICYMILNVGDSELLDIGDKWGRKPIERVVDKKSESYKLLQNWKVVHKIRKLDEFRVAWSKFIDEPSADSRLAVGSNAKKVLLDLKASDWGKEAQGMLEENLIKKSVEEAEKERWRAAKISAQGVMLEGRSGESSNTLADTSGRTVTEYVRQARLQYTKTYRKRVERDRKKLKPSERKLTLIEYLVGQDARKRAQENDAQSKEKVTREKLYSRRLATAQSLLRSRFKGVPNDVTFPSDSIKEPDLKAMKAQEPDELFSQIALTRPWTASVLAQPAKRVQLSILSQVSKKSMEKLQKDDSLSLCPQFYAKRREGFIKDDGELSGPPSMVPSLSDSFLEHDSRETMVSKSELSSHDSMSDVEAMSRPSGSLHAKRETFVASDIRGYSTGVVEKSATSLAAKKRKKGMHQTNQTQEITLRTVKSYEPHILEKKKMNTKPQLNEPALMPPRPGALCRSNLILAGARKEKFTKIEVADALCVLERRLDPESIPKPLKTAIIRSIDSDEKRPRGTVSIAELRERFVDFVHNEEPIDSTKALNALDECLSAKHKYDLLHKTLLPYTGLSEYGPSCPSQFEEKPVNPDPWSGSFCPVSFDNAYRSNHEENPFRCKLFDPRMLG